LVNFCEYAKIPVFRVDLKLFLKNFLPQIFLF
jgi:hypothetical protein